MLLKLSLRSIIIALSVYSFIIDGGVAGCAASEAGETTSVPKTRKPQQVIQETAVARFHQREEQFANVLRSAVWQYGLISVCWENPKPAQYTDLKLIRLSIANTWEKHSNVKFAGWDRCKRTGPAYVRVLLADTDPKVVGGIGSEISGKPNNVILNITFQKDPYLKERCTRSQDARIKCIRGMAIHEFGHVLGFAHEQNRKDTPKWCKDFESGRSGDWTSAIWDRDSVMNYCSSVREGFQEWPQRQNLSEIDILAVQKLYGVPANN